ncbi:hypothetical protein EK21DRAFT_94225 [Setomelanomma holmii]|uniref:alpha-1,3-glucan synthase n=1 Tax=Setomelanomma holmii TaxID=210430 RepID=A0A9P4GYE2_9PLEO|nr:hypothetical protein EK21DRAFT_94225 [Setomelanomma holmii]
MVFPRIANYTAGILRRDPTGLHVSHVAPDANKWRYSDNWGATWSQWQVYEGGNSDLPKQPWSGAKRQQWKGEHVILQYWNRVTGSSDHIQHVDASYNGPPRRGPHLFAYGPYNAFGYDGGVNNAFDMDNDGKWKGHVMTKWPLTAQVNVWGINPDGKADAGFVFGDIDKDVATAAISIWIYMGAFYGVKFNTVGVVLLDAPIFRQQSKTEPYPARMDDLDSAVYYSAWNVCIAQTVETFPIDLSHINDYQGAAAPLYLLSKGRTMPCALSLHNTEFQGLWPMRTPKECDEVCRVCNLEPSIVEKYIQFGEVFNLLHAGASHLRVHQRGFGAVGVSKKYGKQSYARYPIFWGVKEVGRLPNPDLSDTAPWEPEKENEVIAVDRDYEASRGDLRIQAQKWAELEEDPKAELFVFVSRWSNQKGIDLISDIFPAVLETHSNVRLICVGAVVDLYGKFAALKLAKMMEKYPKRSAIEDALFPKQETRGLMRARSAKQRFPVVKWVEHLNTLQQTAFKIHNEEKSPSHKRIFKSRHRHSASDSSLQVPAKSFFYPQFRAVSTDRLSTNDSEAGPIGNDSPPPEYCENHTTLQRGLSLGYRSRPGHRPRASLAPKPLVQIYENRSPPRTPEIHELDPEGGPMSAEFKYRESERQLGLSSLEGNTTNALGRPLALVDISYESHRGRGRSRNPLVPEQDESSSRSRSRSGLLDPSCLSMQQATSHHRRKRSSALDLSTIRTLAQSIPACKSGKTSESDLCVEEFLIDSEKEWFKKMRAERLGRGDRSRSRDNRLSPSPSPGWPRSSLSSDGSHDPRLSTDTSDDASPRSSDESDEFLLGANYQRPTLLKRWMLTRAGDWPIDSFLLAFGQITAANSYQITLLTGPQGQSPEKLYIIGGAPISSWIFRACMIPETQQIHITALFYWGSTLTISSADNALTSSSKAAMITLPIASLMLAIAALLITSLPSSYHQTPGKIPSFYTTLLRRKFVSWFFVMVILQNYFLSIPYGCNWAYI